MSTRYFPFEVTDVPYKPSMGVKPLDLSTWIEIDSNFKSYIEKKKQILNDHKNLVLVAPESLREAIIETQELLSNHLSQNFPELFENTKTHFKTPLGDIFEKSQNPITALTQMSQWIQEDIAFLNPNPPVRLSGGCVCFPSRWNLPQKINMTSDEIHQPVPQFKETISKPTNSFLEKIQVDKPVWRLNWTIHDCPEIFTPYPEESSIEWNAENILYNTYIRMERQTLRRLEKSQYVLFTIRTYILPIESILHDQNKRLALKSTLSHLPVETAHYKGMKRFFDLLKNTL